MVKNSEIFDLSKTIAKQLFTRCTYPWEVLGSIESFINELGNSLPKDEFDHPKENVWIAKDATVFDSAYIGNNVIIDHGACVRHCAFIRENAIVGRNAVVGNSTELKNVVLFDNVEVPHFNYVGDSVLGYKAHFGAGVIASNFRADKGLIKITTEDGIFETGRNKVGCLVGDEAEIGCNSVLNPGTVIGKNSQVYPLSSVRGFVKENCIYKDKDNIVLKK